MAVTYGHALLSIIQTETLLLHIPNAKQGDTGVSGRNYFLEMDATAVKIDGNNIITPDKLTVKGYYRDGNGDREV